MSYVRSWRQVVFTLLAAVVILTTAFGQSDLGSITGFVRDPSGAVIPNVKVSVKNEATGAERVSTTNDAGYYTVTNIPPGLYAVSTESAGFKRFHAARKSRELRAERYWLGLRSGSGCHHGQQVLV